MSQRAGDGRTSRDFGYSLEWLKTSPGARKEQLKQRRFRPRSVAARGPQYVELHTASAFSFLEGSSLPEDLVARAAELGLDAMALLDRNGLYGAPRFYQAARKAGIRALVGAEVSCRIEGTDRLAPEHLPRLALLVASRAGYRNLCRLLTAAARGRPKGQSAVDWSLLEAHSDGLHCLAGGTGCLLARALVASPASSADAAPPQLVDRLAGIFPGRLHLELQRHGIRRQEAKNHLLIQLSERFRLPLIATNGVRYAGRRDRELFDVLTALRHRTTLDEAGRLLAANRERHLKDGASMARLFADQPRALRATTQLAERLDFTLQDLGYRFPDYPLPPGETPTSYLRQVTWNEARNRFQPLTARARAQIEHELAMIERLDLAGYFLIVWDIVQFCKHEHILVQGRGSAANSAVCYALSITAVDPVGMELLFERFLSEERGEWPDIDLDLPSGDQREKVIQYVYNRYGPHGAAMTANVITYRNRSAAREVAKALGFSLDQQNRLSKQLGSWSYDLVRGDPKSMDAELGEAGFDPDAPRLRHFVRMWQKIHNLPRHLGQHSGGMVVAAGRLDEVVPLEPAAMEDRIVVQWDKDDCADLGIIKVDLLGLGMLQALEEAIPMIRTHERVDVDLAHLPPDDPQTYAMIRKADTIGVFQIESRAQMASLPRNAPERFYDLVIQVAIIRPGPIVGGMVHPYFERRLKRQQVKYLHPCLEPILKRTLGVPIFQEQILRMAMDAAGFSGGEAEELRRAMGFKRSTERMHAIEERLRRGMSERGILGDAQDQITQSITSFALYGFPESHAASFALLAYASAYLKCHHPAAFYASLLNAWPMGFYHPATLVKDAQRHGVSVFPADVNHSGWRCRWEAGGIRLGLRFLRGLRKSSGAAIETAAGSSAFTSVADLTGRTSLQEDELAVLAEGGALTSLGLSRRQALWQAAWDAKPGTPLFDSLPGGPTATSPAASPLPEMSAIEETLADYEATGMTTGAHPMSYLRARLRRDGVLPTGTIPRVPDGRRIRTAGTVIVRQRPGTAKGVLFITLEDETGMVQAIVRPELLRKYRKTLVGHPGLIVEGRVQHRDGSLSIQGERFWPITHLAETPSHDFR